MKTRIALWLAVLGAAGLAACGGDDSGGGGTCAAPIALTQGTWCITLTSTSNTCSAPLGSPYWVDLAQTGSTLSMTSQYGYDYTGTLCGSTAVIPSSVPVDVVTRITFTSADAGTGTARWDTGTCTGTDTFTAAVGSCP